MQPIIYDVAVSIDGFICGPGGDISRFAQEGPVIADYSARLEGYATAIMGRATYEFGYRFGMEPGQNPYPHMRTIVVSKSLDLPESAEVDLQPACDLALIEAMRSLSPGPIYLCGPGSQRTLVNRSGARLGRQGRLGDAGAGHGLPHPRTSWLAPVPQRQ
ncbi:MAG: hypothetical protein RIB53_07525, partial [Roseitalea porphyridii]|uniref:dihydrofolate reductase family protein n=1 Tax=Alphaproteobacteria TaxID=28211 RepID=UPI0032EBE345